MARYGDAVRLKTTMLNPLTILAVTVLSGAIGIAVLGSLWRATIPGVGYWISANAVAIVALLAFTLQGHASRWLTFVAANELLAVSLLLVLEGCYRFLGRRTRPGGLRRRAPLGVDRHYRLDLCHAGLQRTGGRWCRRFTLGLYAHARRDDGARSPLEPAALQLLLSRGRGVAVMRRTCLAWRHVQLRHAVAVQLAAGVAEQRRFSRTRHSCAAVPFDRGGDAGARSAR